MAKGTHNMNQLTRAPPTHFISQEYTHEYMVALHLDPRLGEPSDNLIKMYQMSMFDRILSYLLIHLYEFMRNIYPICRMVNQYNWGYTSSVNMNNRLTSVVSLFCYIICKQTICPSQCNYMLERFEKEFICSKLYGHNVHYKRVICESFLLLMERIKTKIIIRRRHKNLDI